MFSYLEWEDRAKCKTLPRWQSEAMFFPTKKDSSPYSRQIVRRFCADCSVQPECLHLAMSLEEVYGNWGGLTQREIHIFRRLLGTRRRKVSAYNGSLSTNRVVSRLAATVSKSNLNEATRAVELEPFIGRYINWLNQQNSTAGNQMVS